MEEDLKISASTSATTPGEEFFLFPDWEKRLKEHRENLEKEEKLRLDKIQRAKSLERSWELLRLCTSYLKENSREWKMGKHQKEMENEIEKEKKKLERLSMAREKKESFERTMVQRKITATLKKLPEFERGKFLKDEEKCRLQDLKEVKENLWKKWRGKENSVSKGKENPTMTLARLEKTVEFWERREKERQDLRQKLERERNEEKLRKMKEDLEKKAKKEKKIMLEKKWEMAKWLSKYIEENKELWEMEGKLRRERETSELEQWEKMKRFEKIAALRKKAIEQEGKHSISRNKSDKKPDEEKWENWRENAINETLEETPQKPPFMNFNLSMLQESRDKIAESESTELTCQLPPPSSDESF